VQQRPAEPEPLLHAARKGGDTVVADLPEPEALEQHADALSPLRDAVETAEQGQVLERRQLPVDERVVAEVADRVPRRQLERALVGREQSGEHAQERRLPRAVGPGHEQEAAFGQGHVDVAEDAAVAEAPGEAGACDHDAVPSTTMSA
jgi:hypothetical protein